MHEHLSSMLDQQVQILQLTFDTEERKYTWAVQRRVWGRVEVEPRRNIFSLAGVGARCISVTLRQYPALTMTNSLCWKGRHLHITAIKDDNRDRLSIEAAAVEVAQCEDRYEKISFPAVVTEKYYGHDQLEPQAINVTRHVLITPKAIKLVPGRLVEVNGVSWPILTAHELDPHKNEYVLERVVDL